MKKKTRVPFPERCARTYKTSTQNMRGVDA